MNRADRPWRWGAGAGAIAAVMATAMAMAMACGGGGGARRPAAPTSTAVTAIAETRGLAREIQLSLERGDATGLAPLCASDLVALGPRATDDGRPRTDTLIALDDALPKAKHKLKVRDQQVESAPGARSAWLTEQVDVDGKRHTVTAIATEVDGLWLVTAVMVGATQPERALRDQEPATLPKLVARNGVPGPTAGNQAAPAAPRAAFALAAGDVEARLAQLDGERTVVMTAAEKAQWRGEQAIRKAWKKGGPRWTLAADMQSGATPDGELVWVAANAATIEAEGEGHPRRLFAVYRRAGDDPPPVPAPPSKPKPRRAAVEPPPPPPPSGPPPPWRLVVLHEIVAR